MQQAIDEAEPEATITICAGTFIGNLVIDNELTLVGAGADATILQGDGTDSVMFLRPLTGTIEIRDLTITDGSAPEFGGGIDNFGAVALEAGASVTENHATNDGGIYNDGFARGGAGASTCSGDSDVSGNTAGDPRVASDCVEVNGGSSGAC